VVTESEPVSMSRETTFDRDLHAVRDRAELGAIFTDLCERVAG
jgi:DNA polymerase-4